MKSDLTQIYKRILPFVQAAPFVFAIPVAAELVQHVAEVRGGMYAAGVEMSAGAQTTRLLFGAVKVLSIFAVILFAVRYWAFDGDARRAARPTAMMLKGLGLFILVQVLAQIALLGGTAAALTAMGDSIPRSAKAAAMLLPVLGWLLAATLLYPWFIGMLVEDRAMTLRRSILAVWGRMWSSFGLLAGAYLPAMVVHYALGYSALGRAGVSLWLILVVDAIVVGLIAAALASGYFTLYRRAAEGRPAAGLVTRPVA